VNLTVLIFLIKGEAFAVHDPSNVFTPTPHPANPPSPFKKGLHTFLFRTELNVYIINIYIKQEKAASKNKL
jgi:hypothetical protein